MKKLNFPLLYVLLILCFFSTGCNNADSTGKNTDSKIENNNASKSTSLADKKQIDTVAYNKLLQNIANGDTTGKWPVKTPYPLSGAIFPYNRIVAFYGNLYSTRMGILGEIPKDSMFKKLLGEVSKWEAADSTLPVIPALHYIAVTAQSLPGKNGKYRLRMPFHQIDTIINWAKEINALVFVDVQVGHSLVIDEVTELEKYLKLPQVHFGIDPEFSMKNGERPGSVIGTFTAADINSVIDYLAKVVKENNLPPKILVIHRFTQGMITNYDKIKTVSEVQVVIDMDGWGDKILKKSSWLRYIFNEPIQFAGFKIFYKNDTKQGKDQLYTPDELSKFIPKPIYIQYQ
jgi:hypothetical protein